MWRKKIVLLNSFWLLNCITSVAQDDSRSARRILLGGKGDFAICDNVHIMHKSCYGRWPGGCPSCREPIKDEKVVEIDSIWVSPDQLAEPCVICRQSISEMSSFEPTAPPLEVTHDKEKRHVALPVAMVYLKPTEKASAIIRAKKEYEAEFEACRDPLVRENLRASWKNYMEAQFTHKK